MIRDSRQRHTHRAFNDISAPYHAPCRRLYMPLDTTWRWHAASSLATAERCTAHEWQLIVDTWAKIQPGSRRTSRAVAHGTDCAWCANDSSVYDNRFSDPDGYVWVLGEPKCVHYPWWERSKRRSWPRWKKHANALTDVSNSKQPVTDCCQRQHQVMHRLRWLHVVPDRTMVSAVSIGWIFTNSVTIFSPGF